MTALPDEGEFVELTFEGEHGSQSPIKGRVEEVDTDPDGHGVEAMFTVDEPDQNSVVHYSEGEADEAGGEFRVVTRWSDFSGSHRLGENAEWRRLE